MKSTFLMLLLVIILISACAPSGQILPTETRSTASPIPPAATATQIPPTATHTPTPAPALPVGQLTPVPVSNETIQAGNIQQLEELARYYGDVQYAAKLTKDGKFLFILEPGGITKYDYGSMAPLFRYPIANLGVDLQISDDGAWVVIDNHWLLDLRDENEPNQYALPDLLGIDAHLFALSPDGSLIAAQRYSCPNLCDHELLIVSTKDFSVLHTDQGPTLQNVFAFSPDGRAYAVVDRVTQETAGGGTEGAGGLISVWDTSDFSKVAGIPLRFPFWVTGIAISPDNSLLAVSQRDFIDIFEIPSGETKATIDGLCQVYQRRILFAPSSPPKLLENSECTTLIWTVTDSGITPSPGSAPDFSKSVFDESGDVRVVPFIYPTTPEFKSYREMYYFRFADNDTLSFKSFDHGSLARRTCDLSLAESSFACEIHEPVHENAQVTGESRILASDGKYYNYTVGASTVEIHSPGSAGQVYYSIPFRNYAFDLLALDPAHRVVFYNMALSGSMNRAVIQDMADGRVLQKWEGETFISELVFSGDQKVAALCLSIGYNNRPNKDKLIVFDLVEKKVISNETFTCVGVSLALNHDGSKMAVEHSYLKNPSDTRYSARVLISNTQPPYDKKYFEVEAPYRAAAFSPDDSILAVSCYESDICFFEAASQSLLHQLKAHSQITDIAFSPDGRLLATSSEWGLISVWGSPPFANR